MSESAFFALLFSRFGSVFLFFLFLTLSNSLCVHLSFSRLLRLNSKCKNAKNKKLTRQKKPNTESSAEHREKSGTTFVQPKRFIIVPACGKCACSQEKSLLLWVRAYGSVLDMSLRLFPFAENNDRAQIKEKIAVKIESLAEIMSGLWIAISLSMRPRNGFSIAGTYQIVSPIYLRTYFWRANASNGNYVHLQ